jgi:hypothetical protein
MHLDVTTFIAVFGVVLGAATILASFRVTRNTQATVLYRENAAGWEAKSKLQTVQAAETAAGYGQQLDELRVQGAEKDQKIADLTARVEVLQDMVTGRSLLEEHHRAFEAKSAELLALAADTRSEVRAMHAILTATGSRPA